MTTTAGHSFYIGPIVFFYNQVNDTGSWEPLVLFFVVVFISLNQRADMAYTSECPFEGLARLLCKPNDDSAGGLFVPEGIIHPVVSVSELT